MPWCDSCDVYLAPNTVSDEGECPRCDTVVDSGDAKTTTGERIPWHFWLVVVALVGYLGWRLIEAFMWLGQQL